MKKLYLILLITLALDCQGQITVDSTKTTVTVREKLPAATKTLSVYRSFVPGQGLRHQLVYQPLAEELGEEPETMKLQFTDESTHIRKMLDAAMAKRQLNISSFSINLFPYEDLARKWVDIYVNSKHWNDYVKKATNLKRTTTLFDGSEVSEVHFYAKMAKYVLDLSDFSTALNDLFRPYGYVVAAINFPEEHQQVFSADKLMLLDKDPNLFIPMPEYSITLAKIKK